MKPTSKLGTRSMSLDEAQIIAAEELKRNADLDEVFALAGLKGGSRPDSVILSLAALDKIAAAVADARAAQRVSEITRKSDDAFHREMENELVTLCMQKFTQRALAQALVGAVGEAKTEAAKRAEPVRAQTRLAEHTTNFDEINKATVDAAVRDQAKAQRS